MKRRVTSIILAIFIMFSTLPVKTVKAATNYDVLVNILKDNNLKQDQGSITGVNSIKYVIELTRYRMVSLALKKGGDIQGLTQNDLSYYIRVGDETSIDVATNQMKLQNLLKVGSSIDVKTKTTNGYTRITSLKSDNREDANTRNKLNVLLFGTEFYNNKPTIVNSSYGNPLSIIGSLLDPYKNESVEKLKPVFQEYDELVKTIGLINTRISAGKISYPTLSSTFKSLYNKYSEISSKDEINSDLLIDDVTDKPGLYKLLNIGNNKNIVKTNYLYMIAATAVYTPLQSALGNSDYKGVLSARDKKLSEVYDYFANFRKPLLKVDNKNIKDILQEKQLNYGTSIVTLRDIKKSMTNNGKDIYVVARNKYQDGTSELESEDKKTNNSNNTNDKNKSDSSTTNESNPLSKTENTSNKADDGNSLSNKDDKSTELNKNVEISEQEKQKEREKIEKQFVDINNRSVYSNVVFATGFWEDSSLVAIDGVDIKLRDFNMLGMILQNAFKRNKLTEDLLDSPVYMDIFGDIVLQDNTVLIPACANYALYGRTLSDTSSVYMAPSEYERCTANKAFLTTYPKLADSRDISSLLKVGDGEKYIFKEPNITDKAKKAGFQIVKATAISGQGKKTNKFLGKVWNWITSGLVSENDNGLIRVNQVATKVNGYSGENKFNMSILEKQGETDYYYLSNNMVDIGSDKFSFANIDSKSSNRFLTELTYQYLGGQVATSKVSGLKSGISQAYLVRNVTLPVFNGFVDTSAFKKDNDKNNDNKADKNNSFFVGLLNSVANGIQSVTRDIKGILGIQDMTSSKIFGPVVIFGFTYGYIIIVLLIVLFIIRLSKQQYSYVTFVCTSLLASVIVVGGFTVLPKYVSPVYNFVANNLSHDISLTSVAFNEEQNYYSKEKLFANYYEGVDTSKLKYGLTLFKMNSTQQELANINFDIGKYDTGKKYIQDTDLFIEGDSLKIDLSSVFNSYKFLDKYDGVYSITLQPVNKNYYSYYMPYEMILQEFVSTLNDYAKVTNCERSQTRYGDNYKDSFLYNSFTSSVVFIAYKQSNQEYEKLIRQKFTGEAVYPMTDFLRIKKGLEITDKSAFNDANSLWMRNYRYIKNKDNGEQIIDKKITAINDNTRTFILDNRDVLSRLSDETAIKLISLYATLEFNQKFSMRNMFLYPFSIDYADINLDNFLQIMIPGKEYVFNLDSLDLADFTYKKADFPGLMLLDFLLVLIPLNSVVFNIMYYFMYFLFIIFLITKLCKKETYNPLIFGFLRLCFVLVGCYWLSNLFYYVMYKYIDSTIWRIVWMFIFNVALFDTLITLLTSIRENLLDFGWGSLRRVISDKSEKIKRVIRRKRGGDYSSGDAIDTYGYDKEYDDDFGDYRFDNIEAGLRDREAQYYENLDRRKAEERARTERRKEESREEVEEEYQDRNR